MRLAVTGHRPAKLGGWSPQARERLYRFAISRFEAMPFYPERVLTGMALGWDLAVAEACRTMGIPFIAYVPCEGQELRWNPEDQQRYRELLGAAHEIENVPGGEYAAYKMLRRDEAMVDACDELLALWNGSSGGTAHTVNYARQGGLFGHVKITNCWPEWLEFSPLTSP